MLRRSSPAPPARLFLPSTARERVIASTAIEIIRRTAAAHPVAAGIAVATMALAAPVIVIASRSAGDAVGRAAAELPNSLSLPVPPSSLSPDLPAA